MSFRNSTGRNGTLRATIRRRLRHYRRSKDAGQSQLRQVLGKPWICARQSREPESNNNFTRYEWINPNPRYNADGLPIFEGPQQLGRVLSVSGARADFTPAVTYDPDLKDDYTQSASLYFEREVAANFGVRTGFVWNGVRNPRTTRERQPTFRGIQSAHAGRGSRARWTSWHQ
jgi:hypothetical protein